LHFAIETAVEWFKRQLFGSKSACAWIGVLHCEHTRLARDMRSTVNRPGVSSRFSLTSWPMH
jgi:hypothetical protein